MTTRGFALARDAELLHPLPQRVPVDPQQLGSLELISSDALQDGLQEGAFGHGENVIVQLPILLPADSPELRPDFAPKGSRRADRSFSLGYTGSCLQGVRKVFREDEAGPGQEACPFDHILEFPHIAGPGVAQQAFQALRRDLFAVLSGIEPQEVVHQEQDILLTLPEGRKRNGHHVQPVEEILPEAPSRHQGPKIPVGGGQDADVRGDRHFSP